MPSNDPFIATVSPASRGDANKIAELKVKSWRAAYKDLLPAQILADLSVEKQTLGWAETLQSGSSLVLKQKINQELIGFLAARASQDSDATSKIADLGAIYLDPEHFRKGFGKQLLTVAFKELTKQGFDQVTLWVLDSNTAAINFYESQGFKDDQSQKPYYIAGYYEVQVKRFRRDLK